MATLSFRIVDATLATYKTFIQNLRSRLTAGRPLSHRIPVLPKREEIPDQRRFLLVDLTDFSDNKITVAIYVVNVYVVGYAANGVSYFLLDNAREHPAPIEVLFPETKRAPRLHFDGSYAGLAGAAPGPPSGDDASKVLERIGLGRTELGNAIENLFFAKNESLQAVGFIVVIQMLSEAARFPTIEYLISNSMGVDNAPCKRGFVMESLQLNWSSLSAQIQGVKPGQTQFKRPVELRNRENQPFYVSSVDDKFVKDGGIAMLLYDRDQGKADNPGPSLPEL